jgi:hypothetical protein
MIHAYCLRVQICYRYCKCKPIPQPPTPPPQACIQGRTCRFDDDCGKSGECVPMRPFGNYLSYLSSEPFEMNPLLLVYKSCMCKKIPQTPTPSPQACIQGAKCKFDDDCGKNGECSMFTGQFASWEG